ncbi:hypothetical protein J6590_045377 [Homalodisca vitripennis]|nr:hypothetical protein J6590_045377 [Homalodisca vitripennis]
MEGANLLIGDQLGFAQNIAPLVVGGEESGVGRGGSCKYGERPHKCTPIFGTTSQLYWTHTPHVRHTYSHKANTRTSYVQSQGRQCAIYSL